MNEEEIQKQAEQQIDLIKKLIVNESFLAWVNGIVKPGIAQLEAEIASKEADLMPEVILRAKLKHINSLKLYFDDVFTLINQQ